MLKEKGSSELLKRVREGDTKAFEQLFNNYWEPLFSASMYRLQSEELSKDILQELFTDLWEKRHTIDIHTNIRGYLYTALKHRIINKIKSENIRHKYEKLTIQFYKTNGLATEHLFTQKLLKEELTNQLEYLPGRCREVFKLSRIDHLSHKEISKRLSISPKTVENHIGRALKILRPQLKRMVSLLLVISLRWL